MSPNGATAEDASSPHATSGDEADSDPESVPRPVVGVGASAGGVTALQNFFEAIPADTDMAFVVVLHLAGDEESNLTQVLRQTAALSMVRAEDGMQVRGGHGYVIPPGTHLEIHDGRLGLRDTGKIHDTSTIDHFFRSLAADQKHNAVAIVLSGTGTDGTLGIRAIKENGGVAFVQAPAEAEYDHMPRSAVATGIVDLSLPVEELANQLLEYRDSAGVLQFPKDESQLDSEAQNVLQRIFTRLYSEVGHDFSGYKRSTVLRRLERRMQINSITSLDAYLQLLRKDDEETHALKKDLLITVTNFFRDAEAFEALAESVLPNIFAQKGPTDQVRIWVPGCATGEEAYSLAMLLLEHTDGMKEPPDLQVFATDVEEDALQFGRKGLYPETIEADVPQDRLDRFFLREEEYYRIRPRLKETVLFAEHDVLTDPPFSSLDLVSCRNLLIYLRQEMQQHILRVIHYALREDGYLFLGRSETVGRQTDLFSMVDESHNILKARVLAEGQQPEVPVSVSKNKEDGGKLFSELKQQSREAAPRNMDRPSAGELHREALMQEVASLLVDDDYNLLHFSDQAARHLRLGDRVPTSKILRLVPEAVRTVLQTALYQAFEKGKSSRYPRIEVQDGEETVILDVRVRPITSFGPQTYAHIRVDEPSYGQTDGDMDSNDTREGGGGQSELERTREQLQTTTEEYEAATEEMESANEELLSMNEELQSKNQELRTSKEELQSVNEELKTTNQELESKIEELRSANSDLENLMAATEIATLFLNRELEIERFTPPVKELFNIRPHDVGRPLTDFTRRFEYDGLIEDAREVLRALEPIEREVRQGEDTWYLMRLRPYRTVEDEIEGVVLTFVDISSRRRLERQLIDATEEVRQKVGQNLHDALASDLAAATMMLESSRSQIANETPEVAGKIAEVIELVRDSSEVARNLSHELVPPALQDENLARSLQQLCETQSGRFDLEYAFTGDLGEDLPASEETAIHLYRIAQEALSNARQHGDATRIEVNLRRREATLRMRIRDNGVGIPDDITTASGDHVSPDGIGLRTMHHRANLVGGALTIQAEEDGGTTVVFTMPLETARRR